MPCLTGLFERKNYDTATSIVGKGTDMKPEITKIEIDFTAWDERRPCFATLETEEGEDGGYVDSAKDILSEIEETLKTSRLTRETQIHISYKTDTAIPLTMTCQFSMQKILYFRNKPKYGIDFLPSEKMTDEARWELVRNIFSNADKILQEEIIDVIDFLFNTGVEE